MLQEITASPEKTDFAGMSRTDESSNQTRMPNPFLSKGKEFLLLKQPDDFTALSNANVVIDAIRKDFKLDSIEDDSTKTSFTALVETLNYFIKRSPTAQRKDDCIPEETRKFFDTVLQENYAAKPRLMQYLCNYQIRGIYEFCRAVDQIRKMVIQKIIKMKDISLQELRNICFYAASTVSNDDEERELCCVTYTLIDEMKSFEIEYSCDTSLDPKSMNKFKKMCEYLKSKSPQVFDFVMKCNGMAVKCMKEDKGSGTTDDSSYPLIVEPLIHKRSNVNIFENYVEDVEPESYEKLISATCAEGE